MKHQEDITRSAGIVGLFTLVSRITGYIRDMVIAYLFGARAETDAYYVAFRIPNLLRRLLAEGSLTVSFIPVFTEYLEKKGKEEAKKVADATFTTLSAALLIISFLGVAFSPLIVKLFASGFKGELFNLAVNLNRIMFPYIIFASLTALSMGILNSVRHFFAPSFSQVIFNITSIGIILLIYKSLNPPILSLAIGVIIGGALQFLFQIPFLKKKHLLHSFSRNIYHPAVRKIALLMAPQTFGLAVYNLNILVSTQFASHLPEGTVSYLYYSERLIEFPLGTVAVSIATALLPTLSFHITRGEAEKFRESYSFALRLMLYVMIPALIGLIVLRIPICNLLYQRGEFSYEATVRTSEALLGYAVGLWAVGGIRITVPTFYAIQDTKTPVLIAFIAFLANAFFGYLLGFVLGLKHLGLALASSLSSILNFTILFLILRKRAGYIEIEKHLLFIAKVILTAFIMGLAAWTIASIEKWTESTVSLKKVVVFSLSMLIPALLYIGLSKLLRIEEVSFILRMIRRKS
jgi:putative peptidoglycan lipid II flippase